MCSLICAAMMPGGIAKYEVIFFIGPSRPSKATAASKKPNTKGKSKVSTKAVQPPPESPDDEYLTPTPRPTVARGRKTRDVKESEGMFMGLFSAISCLCQRIYPHFQSKNHQRSPANRMRNDGTCLRILWKMLHMMLLLFL